ncbi:MAG TPA: hypothetical protein VNO26_04090 [Candidatus Limnocylindria bacterium]|nr:hypothetical protein [Candidatus Limnocylindria bacterium]
MRSAIAAVLLATVVLARGDAAAQVSAGQPQLLTIEGILAPDQAAADKVGYDPLSLGFKGGESRRWLGVVAARSLQGDAFRGKEMIEHLLPNQPNLLVSGDAELVAKLQNAPDGSRVVVQGILVPQSRNWMIDKVDVVPAPAKP